MDVRLDPAHLLARGGGVGGGVKPVGVEGKRVAVLGLGRSGLAVAQACLERGAKPSVFDSKSRASLAKPEIAHQLEELNVPLTFEFEGHWTPAEFDMVVTNPAVHRKHPTLVNSAQAGVEVVSEVEFAHRISLAPIVAITGTNGKSTTTVMTWLALRACGEDAILCGNLYGSGYEERPLTEAAAQARRGQVLVAEISSFQLEWIHQFRPIVAGITTITPDHLDRYDNSFEEYAQTKHQIWRNLTETEFAVCREDDPHVKPPNSGQGVVRGRPNSLRARAETRTPRVFTFGPRGADASASEKGFAVFGRSVLPGSLPFRESHNLLNAAMALLITTGVLGWRERRDPLSRAAILLAEARRQGQVPRKKRVSLGMVPDYGVPEIAIEGLKQFRGLAHRMQAVGERDGVLVINNSMCTNPDAVIKSAQGVGRPSRLLIGGVNKELDFAPLKRFLASSPHVAYLFGSDAPALGKMLDQEDRVYQTMEQAFVAASEAAKDGEAIMLSPGCASTDQFRDFVDRGNVFTQLATDWLAR
ncbi:MAG: UDP-N-acetylmuramoyl-L-alanine--D-glutamate ligase [Fimbriimonas sp.]